MQLITMNSMFKINKKEIKIGILIRCLKFIRSDYLFTNKILLINFMDYFSLSDNSTSNFTESSDISISFTPLYWPPTMFANLGMFILSIVSILGNAGGIGGAGVNIPMMMIFFGLTIKECVPIANIFGLGAALVRFIINFKRDIQTIQREQ